ncbi:MAG: PilZ domain-containing protein [Chromatiales bacterium]|nr:PilZ domain-containing protein [Chromatiales bacterium]
MASLRQRASLRQAPPCSALVKSGSTCLIPKAISDISLDGLFVELDSAGMVPGDIVELMLEFSDPRRTVDLQIAAEVVRVEASGVGLHFCDYGNQTYTELVNLLYAR